MMLDIFDIELVVFESYESLCLGVCVFGFKVVGDIEDFLIVLLMVGVINNYMLFEENVVVY